MWEGWRDARAEGREQRAEGRAGLSCLPATSRQLVGQLLRLRRCHRSKRNSSPEVDQQLDLMGQLRVTCAHISAH